MSVRRIVGTVCATVLLAGCASASPQEVREQNEEFLAIYVEQERAVADQFEAANPGLYEYIAVDGYVRYYSPSVYPELPEELFSAIRFHYAYPYGVSAQTTAAGLETQRASLDDLCHSDVLPAMREAGITGPVAALWQYSPPGGRPFWHHWCYEVEE